MANARTCTKNRQIANERYSNSIGDSDIKDVVNEAISTFANGSFANTVEGTMPCYANGTINASIEWIVRKAQ